MNLKNLLTILENYTIIKLLNNFFFCKIIRKPNYPKVNNMNEKLKTYYTKDICIESYGIIRLICKAKDKFKALRIFKIHIKNDNFLINNTVLTINNIKELTNKVKTFTYIE